MLFRSNAVFLVTILILAANAFRPTLFISTTTARSARLPTSLGTAGKPPPSAEVASDLNMAEIDIPKNLPSAVGKDYVPLATMLATGQLAEADQFTRDALIDLCGGREKGRSFVYWTEVKKIPGEDLATIERLWNRFSGGKFGYSVQREIWNKGGGDWEKFCSRVGWTTKDGEVERKLKWFGASEFIYDVQKAKPGHLPLTSALRGTALIRELMAHPVWDNDDWKKDPNNL